MFIACPCFVSIKCIFHFWWDLDDLCFVLSSYRINIPAVSHSHTEFYINQRKQASKIEGMREYIFRATLLKISSSSSSSVHAVWRLLRDFQKLHSTKIRTKIHMKYFSGMFFRGVSMQQLLVNRFSTESYLEGWQFFQYVVFHCLKGAVSLKYMRLHNLWAPIIIGKIVSCSEVA